MESKNYKYCVVPQCKNTTIKTKNKLFVHVPNKAEIRKKWLKLARRDPNSYKINSAIYFCEDHFDMPNDMLNYMEYYIMGRVSQMRMRPGCIPSKFECQTSKCKSNSEYLPIKNKSSTSKNLKHRTKTSNIKILPKTKPDVSSKSKYQTMKHASFITKTKPNILRRKKILDDIYIIGSDSPSGNVQEESTDKFVQMFPVEALINEESWNATESETVNLNHVFVHFLPDDCHDELDADMQSAPDCENVATPHNQLCRICFDTNSDMQLITKYNKLGQAYEILTGFLIDSESILPPYLCPECAHRLLNYMRFRHRGLEAHSFLLEVLKHHNYITLESINATNGYQKLLGSRLGITHIPADQYDLEIKHEEQQANFIGKYYFHDYTILHPENGMIIQNSYNDMDAVHNVINQIPSMTDDDDNVGNDINRGNSDNINEEVSRDLETSNDNMILTSLDKDTVFNINKIETDEMAQEEVYYNAQISDDNTVYLANLYESTIASEIKAEKDDMNNQEDCDAEVSNDIACLTIRFKDNVDGIRAELDEIINQEVQCNVINNGDTVMLVPLHGETEVKMKDVVFNQNNYNVERISNNVGCLNNMLEDTLAPEVKVENDEVIAQDRFGD